MSVGTQIMYNRKLKKLTQEDLGDLLGVSYMTIRRWQENPVLIFQNCKKYRKC